ncbi:ABC transporter permease [Microbacterium telephonicum]|uniref:ABC-2 type transport system permease protein n=1 Tax=Microbacterium telephonicum TaxID=1714841 RepID=A0A498C2P6_9MICO|nr:polyketide antibiotic transporter [Microbacterium telephonicum]RLK46701.1 ABC-2 type transport system permease protein [Microbacterium telephonicum]
MSALAPLLRQRARRDRVQVVLWAGGTFALAAAAYPGVSSSYGDAQERTALLTTVMANPVILLFRGLPSGAELAQMVVFLLLPWLLLLAALMSTFLAVRHTRADEESGRMELLSGTPAARWSPTVATLVHGVAANVVLGALVFIAFLSASGQPFGSLLVATSCTLTGVVFLTIALLAAQVMPTSRGANALAVWVLLGTFMLAGVGNALGTPSDDLTRMQSSWLTWLSPFGWAENVRAFDTDTAAPLLLLAAVAVAFGAVALALQGRRDVGGAFLPERVGRADARAGFGSSPALVIRLARTSVVGWLIGGLLVGLLATSLGGVVDEIGGGNPAVADVIARLGGDADDLRLGIVVVFFVMLGVLAACAGVQTVIRARQEEARGTAEVVLAEPVTRVRWLAEYVVVALAAATLTCLAGVAGAALGALGSTDPGPLVREAVVAGAGQIAAAWVFTALTALVFVLAPRLTIALGWVLVMVAAMIGLFGPLFGMDQDLTGISPFAAAPVPTGDGTDVRGLWWLATVAVACSALALGLMRRREVAAGE